MTKFMTLSKAFDAKSSSLKHIKYNLNHKHDRFR